MSIIFGLFAAGSIFVFIFILATKIIGGDIAVIRILYEDTDIHGALLNNLSFWLLALLASGTIAVAAAYMENKKQQTIMVPGTIEEIIKQLELAKEHLLRKVTALSNGNTGNIWRLRKLAEGTDGYSLATLMNTVDELTETINQAHSTYRETETELLNLELKIDEVMKAARPIMEQVRLLENQVERVEELNRFIDDVRQMEITIANIKKDIGSPEEREKRIADLASSVKNIESDVNHITGDKNTV